MKMIELFKSNIESLAGKQISIKSTVTNFLGNAGQNQTTVIFSSIKQIMIIDLQDIYTFQVDVNNTIAPRIRLPYCSSENSST